MTRNAILTLRGDDPWSDTLQPLIFRHNNAYQDARQDVIAHLISSFDHP